MKDGKEVMALLMESGNKMKAGEFDLYDLTYIGKMLEAMLKAAKYAIKKAKNENIQ